MPDYINVSDDLKNKDSKVRISDEVIAAIAGVAASQVEECYYVRQYCR